RGSQGGAQQRVVGVGAVAAHAGHRRAFEDRPPSSGLRGHQPRHQGRVVERIEVEVREGDEGAARRRRGEGRRNRRRRGPGAERRQQDEDRYGEAPRTHGHVRSFRGEVAGSLAPRPPPVVSRVLGHCCTLSPAGPDLPIHDAIETFRVREKLGRTVLSLAAAPVAVALVTLFGRAMGTNAAAAGLLYLMPVLGLATAGGWPAGALTSILATVCLNYFFLPPVGTLQIADPANWVALTSFLAASTLASRLVASARAQAREARLRQRQVEALYDLCFGLFAASPRLGTLGDAAAVT